MRDTRSSRSTTCGHSGQGRRSIHHAPRMKIPPPSIDSNHPRTTTANGSLTTSVNDWRSKAVVAGIFSYERWRMTAASSSFFLSVCLSVCLSPFRHICVASHSNHSGDDNASSQTDAQPTPVQSRDIRKTSVVSAEAAARGANLRDVRNDIFLSLFLLLSLPTI